MTPQHSQVISAQATQQVKKPAQHFFGLHFEQGLQIFGQLQHENNVFSSHVSTPMPQMPMPQNIPSSLFP
jgi:hypothetical protein